MDILLLILILVISMIVFEVSKHVFFKSFSKTFLMVIFVIVVFFIIISTLESEGTVETENPFVETGAAVVDSVKEQDFFESIEDKMTDFKDNIRDIFD